MHASSLSPTRSPHRSFPPSHLTPARIESLNSNQTPIQVSAPLTHTNKQQQQQHIMQASQLTAINSDSINHSRSSSVDSRIIQLDMNHSMPVNETESRLKLLPLYSFSHSSNHGAKTITPTDPTPVVLASTHQQLFVTRPLQAGATLDNIASTGPYTVTSVTTHNVTPAHSNHPPTRTVTEPIPESTEARALLPLLSVSSGTLFTPSTAAASPIDSPSASILCPISLAAVHFDSPIHVDEPCANTQNPESVKNALPSLCVHQEAWAYANRCAVISSLNFLRLQPTLKTFWRQLSINGSNYSAHPIPFSCTPPPSLAPAHSPPNESGYHASLSPVTPALFLLYFQTEAECHNCIQHHPGVVHRIPLADPDISLQEEEAHRAELASESIKGLLPNSAHKVKRRQNSTSSSDNRSSMIRLQYSRAERQFVVPSTVRGENEMELCEALAKVASHPEARFTAHATNTDLILSPSKKRDYESIVAPFHPQQTDSRHAASAFPQTSNHPAMLRSASSSYAYELPPHIDALQSVASTPLDTTVPSSVTLSPSLRATIPASSASAYEHLPRRTAQLSDRLLAATSTSAFDASNDIYSAATLSSTQPAVGTVAPASSFLAATLRDPLTVSFLDKVSEKMAHTEQPTTLAQARSQSQYHQQQQQLQLHSQHSTSLAASPIRPVAASVSNARPFCVLLPLLHYFDAPHSPLPPVDPRLCLQSNRELNGDDGLDVTASNPNGSVVICPHQIAFVSLQRVAVCRTRNVLFSQATKALLSREPGSAFSAASASTKGISQSRSSAAGAAAGDHAGVTGAHAVDSNPVDDLQFWRFARFIHDDDSHHTHDPSGRGFLVHAFYFTASAQTHVGEGDVAVEKEAHESFATQVCVLMFRNAFERSRCVEAHPSIVLPVGPQANTSGVSTKEELKDSDRVIDVIYSRRDGQFILPPRLWHTLAPRFSDLDSLHTSTELPFALVHTLRKESIAMEHATALQPKLVPITASERIARGWTPHVTHAIDVGDRLAASTRLPQTFLPGAASMAAAAARSASLEQREAIMAARSQMTLSAPSVYGSNTTNGQGWIAAAVGGDTRGEMLPQELAATMNHAQSMHAASARTFSSTSGPGGFLQPASSLSSSATFLSSRLSPSKMQARELSYRFHASAYPVLLNDESLMNEDNSHAKRDPRGFVQDKVPLDHILAVLRMPSSTEMNQHQFSNTSTATLAASTSASAGGLKDVNSERENDAKNQARLMAAFSNDTSALFNATFNKPYWVRATGAEGRRFAEEWLLNVSKAYRHRVKRDIELSVLRVDVDSSLAISFLRHGRVQHARVVYDFNHGSYSTTGGRFRIMSYALLPAGQMNPRAQFRRNLPEEDTDRVALSDVTYATLESIFPSSASTVNERTAGLCTEFRFPPLLGTTKALPPEQIRGMDLHVDSITGELFRLTTPPDDAFPYAPLFAPIALPYPYDSFPPDPEFPRAEDQYYNEYLDLLREASDRHKGDEETPRTHYRSARNRVAEEVSDRLRPMSPTGEQQTIAGRARKVVSPFASSSVSDRSKGVRLDFSPPHRDAYSHIARKWNTVRSTSTTTGARMHHSQQEQQEREEKQQQDYAVDYATPFRSRQLSGAADDYDTVPAGGSPPPMSTVRKSALKSPRRPNEPSSPISKHVRIASDEVEADLTATIQHRNRSRSHTGGEKRQKQRVATTGSEAFAKVQAMTGARVSGSALQMTQPRASPEPQAMSMSNAAASSSSSAAYSPPVRQSPSSRQFENHAGLRSNESFSSTAYASNPLLASLSRSTLHAILSPHLTAQVMIDPAPSACESLRRFLIDVIHQSLPLKDRQRIFAELNSTSPAHIERARSALRSIEQFVDEVIANKLKQQAMMEENARRDALAEIQREEHEALQKYSRSLMLHPSIHTTPAVTHESLEHVVRPGYRHQQQLMDPSLSQQPPKLSSSQVHSVAACFGGSVDLAYTHLIGRTYFACTRNKDKVALWLQKQKGDCTIVRLSPQAGLLALSFIVSGTVQHIALRFDPVTSYFYMEGIYHTRDVTGKPIHVDLSLHYFVSIPEMVQTGSHVFPLPPLWVPPANVAALLKLKQQQQTPAESVEELQQIKPVVWRHQVQQSLEMATPMSNRPPFPHGTPHYHQPHFDAEPDV